MFALIRPSTYPLGYEYLRLCFRAIFERKKRKYQPTYKLKITTVKLGYFSLKGTRGKFKISKNRFTIFSHKKREINKKDQPQNQVFNKKFLSKNNATFYLH